MKANLISVNDAIEMSVKVGKLIIDKGEANGGKIKLNEIKDIFEHSISKSFIPQITTREKAFQKYCEKFGMSEEQAEVVKKYAAAVSLPKPNCKGYFIYVPKNNINNSHIQVGSDIGHELFHTLSRGKTEAGKNNLKELRKLLKNGFRFTPETNLTIKGIDIQSLLMNAFKIKDLATPSEEVDELYSHLQTDKRCFAYIRTALRTLFDPRLKQGEQKTISKMHLPIEKTINPDAISIRPTNDDIDFSQNILKEESRAYQVSAILELYGYKLPPDTPMIKQIIATTFARAYQLLKGEKEILTKNIQ